jgi:hypothetical protein
VVIPHSSFAVFLMVPTVAREGSISDTSCEPLLGVIPQNVTWWGMARQSVHRRVTRVDMEANLMLLCNSGNVGKHG